MDNKGITFADVSRSLNRLDGFIDDFLLTVQSYNEKRIIEKANVIVDSHKETMVIYPIDIKKSIIGFIDEVKFNREGDESINYYGIHDCVDYILNNQSLLLVKRAFSIETKIKEAEQILLSFLSEIEETSELLWQTGQILWEIGELHIEPFIQETSHIENNPIPETGNNNEVYYEYEIFDGVEEKYINKYKKSFNYDEDKYTSFFVKCEGKTPYEIAAMLYNCNDFYNCRAIKAVYFVCVVPTMTDDNHITYEAFLNHYKSIDNAQG